MKFFIKGHNFLNEVQTTIQIFFPNEGFTKINNLSDTDDFVSVILENDIICSSFYRNSKVIESYLLKDNGDTANNIKLCIYYLLNKMTGIKSSWGILTGVRPSKIAGKLLNESYNDSEIIDFMKNKYLVSEEKSRLCLDVYKKEAEIIKYNNGNDISLYIGIPFCPTRCVYCSFTSYPISKYQNKIDDYIKALEKEMIFLNKYFKNRYLESIYIGGGTPTSLSFEDLDTLLYLISKYFNVGNLKEYTVEAGRPDTITSAKLRILKKYNVSRISINPQTMNDETLVLIGRNHTVNDFLKSFEIARKLGFNNINIDIILGLPNETCKDVENTMKEIIKLNPESITVHTLAVKRASKLKEELNSFELAKIEDIENMIKITRDYCKKIDLEPYYLYRQKNMTGNFENVGYCKKGFECIYNVQIMEEKQTVMAIGAGATSKIVDLVTDRIERIFNVKNIDDYLNRIDEMVERKENNLKGGL